MVDACLLNLYEPAANTGTASPIRRPREEARLASHSTHPKQHAPLTLPPHAPPDHRRDRDDSSGPAPVDYPAATMPLGERVGFYYACLL